MVLYVPRSCEVLRASVTKGRESLKRNQRACCGAGKVKSRGEEHQHGEVCKVEGTRRLVERVDLENWCFVSTKQQFLENEEDRLTRWVANITERRGASAQIWGPDTDRREVDERSSKHLPGGLAPGRGLQGR